MPPNAVPPVLRSTSLGWSRFLNSSDPGGTREGESGGLTLPLSFVSSLPFLSKNSEACDAYSFHWGKAEKESDDRLTCHSGRLYPRDKTQFKTFFISHPIFGQLWGVQLKLSNFLVQWRPNAFAPALIFFISLHKFQGLWNTLLFRCKFFRWKHYKYIWVNFPRKGKRVKMWHFFWSPAVT